MKYFIFLVKTIFLIIPITESYNSFFNYWHCIAIKENIDLTKPFSINIGELPLIIWQKSNNEYGSAINSCLHMGSKLDNAKIVKDGCLQCQYHGFKYEKKNHFGEIKECEGKLYWSYKPNKPLPYRTPFYNNVDYVNSMIQIDMPCSLEDSAYNTIDLRHPEYVHNNLFGFGSNLSPSDIKQYDYGSGNMGLSFTYPSNSKVITSITKNSTDNFHIFNYPTFSWSRVTVDKDNKKNNLIISVNLLPLEKKKTRWFVTVCHNYYKTPLKKQLMKGMALTILMQDFNQMFSQASETKLKKEMLFTHEFENEEIIGWLHEYFKKNYKYPDEKECVELWNDYKLFH
jgi:phenylpropionate dioxygenase-like ring-hydroxylating dioxygenase large terminal subunit